MSGSTTPHSPLPVIIDTDPGIDDCLALWLALNSPELDVRGISVSYGNTLVENAHRNTVEILRRAGITRRVPIAIGARRPLKRQLAVALETHGESGLGYALGPVAIFSLTMNTRGLSGRQDLNLRPPEPHSGALPGCATPRRGAYSTALPPAV